MSKLEGWGGEIMLCGGPWSVLSYALVSLVFEHCSVRRCCHLSIQSHDLGLQHLQAFTGSRNESMEQLPQIATKM